jgi:hypothetical protein
MTTSRNRYRFGQRMNQSKWRRKFRSLWPRTFRTAGSILAQLLTYHKGAHHKLVILDEPENSLHPDAQHLLREFLFDLTEGGQTQVVYATHSAAMINPMRPDQIRVLVRGKSGQTATTKLLSRPTDANFFGLRTSLGMSAADSLLFAPITITCRSRVEGRCAQPPLPCVGAASRTLAYASQ